MKRLVRRILSGRGYELVRSADFSVLQRRAFALQEHLNLLNEVARHESGPGKGSSESHIRDGRMLGDRAVEQHHESRSPPRLPSVGIPTGPKPDAVGSDVRFWPPRYPFPSLPGFPPGRLSLRVVDVGAEPLEFEEDIYAPLVREAPCHIIGFDPFWDGAAGGAPETGPEIGAPCKRVLPYFIGTGGPATFHLNNFSPTSSLFPTNPAIASQFLHLAELCRTTKTWPVETRRLDDLPEVGHCDFLKVDVQGGDYDVIAGAERLLGTTLFVHIEVEFAELYLGQKLFPDIDSFLRAQGFELIDLVKLGWNNYRAMPSVLLRSRLLWADAIYMKRTDRISEMDDPALLRAAFIAHVNYRKYDLAAHLIAAYDTRPNSALLPAYTASFID